MDLRSTFLLTFIGQVYLVSNTHEQRGYRGREEVGSGDRGPGGRRAPRCCNGTLGYASDKPEKMPCASMLCCDEKESVAAFPINAALNYVFRCTSNHQVTKCANQGDVVFTTNKTAMTYGPRFCCQGFKFKVTANSMDSALQITCIRS
ncbi:uncharacterized protein LOC110446765 [Mizuhopecten yessoensis]|uniref:Uncharacterized protein n=1 Tax=Mizuhopecten yessoensis TaxID=6573 RepID=A0A210QWM9_MIZYE|nr:uncharacterized protein LOC110446765 [Mizuhopecten yessoensis]OWF53147.1 hypothetical protein KP79_PYT07010 [Mizuhopecten yessoensis]